MATLELAKIEDFIAQVKAVNEEGTVFLSVESVIRNPFGDYYHALTFKTPENNVFRHIQAILTGQILSDTLGETVKKQAEEAQKKIEETIKGAGLNMLMGTWTP